MCKQPDWPRNHFWIFLSNALGNAFGHATKRCQMSKYGQVSNLCVGKKKLEHVLGVKSNLSSLPTIRPKIWVIDDCRLPHSYCNTCTYIYILTDVLTFGECKKRLTFGVILVQNEQTARSLCGCRRPNLGVLRTSETLTFCPRKLRSVDSSRLCWGKLSHRTPALPRKALAAAFFTFISTSFLSESGWHIEWAAYLSPNSPNSRLEIFEWETGGD